MSSPVRLSDAPDWVRALWSSVTLGSSSRFGGDLSPSLLASWAGDGAAGAACFWELARWDSAQLGLGCSKVHGVVGSDRKPDDLEPLCLALRSFAAEARGADVVNAFFRVNCDDLPAEEAARSVGFRPLGIHLDFGLDVDPSAPPDTVRVEVRRARPEEGEDLAALASLFEEDRFHRDRRFPREKVEALWSESIRNAVSDWAEATFLYDDGGEPGAFITLVRSTEDDRTEGRVFLIAIAPRLRGRGIGKALLSACHRYCQEEGFDTLLVGTQATNLPAISLYGSFGFRLRRVSCELSWWLDRA